MALKRKITKDAYDKLSDDLKKEYVLKDGGYILDTEDDDDFERMTNSVREERQKRKDAEKRLRDLEEDRERTDAERNKKNGDVAALEASWTKKLSEKEAENAAKLAKRDEHIRKALIDGTAARLASEISTVPALMSKVIRERLTVDFDGDEPALRVLDASGKPSAFSVEDLRTELVKNKDLASIIVASQGSGSGGPNGGSRGDPTKRPPVGGTPENFAAMKPGDLAARLKAQRDTSKT